MLSKTIKHSVEEKQEMNVPRIECNRTDNDEQKEFTNNHIDIDIEDEMIKYVEMIEVR